MPAVPRSKACARCCTDRVRHRVPVWRPSLSKMCACWVSWGSASTCACGPRNWATVSSWRSSARIPALWVDHCGNGDPYLISGDLPGSGAGGDAGQADSNLTIADHTDRDDPFWHDRQQWKDGIDALAALPNTICKISGIIARTPPRLDRRRPGAGRQPLPRQLRPRPRRLRRGTGRSARSARTPPIALGWRR